jgi:hypothetical protein
MGSNQQKEHGNFFYSSVKQSSSVFQGHVTLLLNKFFLVCSSGTAQTWNNTVSLMVSDCRSGLAGSRLQ